MLSSYPGPIAPEKERAWYPQKLFANVNIYAKIEGEGHTHDACMEMHRVNEIM